MFIAMNHFKVNPERGSEFEAVWRDRESYLAGVPGFIEFALLKGDDPSDYISHSVWESREHFREWAKSDHFRRAHEQAGPPEGVITGHPHVTLYDAVIVERPEGAPAH